MVHSHCTGLGPEQGQGLRLGTMGYHILCSTVHTVLEPGQGQGPGNLSKGFQPFFKT